MNKFLFAVRERLQPVTGGLLLILISLIVLGNRLGSLTPGLSQAEAELISSVAGAELNLDWVMAHSLYLPYHLAVLFLQQIGQLTAGSLRAVSGGLGLLAITSFYLISRAWYTRRVALLGSSLLLTSNWFLHLSRLGQPEAMYLLILPLIYLIFKLEEGTQRLSIVVLIMLLTVALLYAPAMIWLVLAAAVWQRRRLNGYLQEIPIIAAAVIGLAGLILLTPLIVGLAADDSSWQHWLGWPVGLEWRQFGRQLLTVPWQLAVRQPANAVYHLAELPWLDVATSTLAGLGIYRQIYRRRLDRVKLLAGGIVYGSLLWAAWGPAASGLLMIFVYLLAASGLALLLQQWFTVFPRNPLARGVGLAVVSGLVGLISFYHLQRYFVAWPQAPETRAVFQQPRP